MKTIHILVALVIISLIAFVAVIVNNTDEVIKPSDKFVIAYQGNLTGEVNENDLSILKFEDFSIMKSIAYDNLQIFLFRGDDNIKGKKYICLSDALKQKKITINETGNVNELSIDNWSNSYVFIHSGDIVKGGRQDRTISYDIIVPPNSKNIKLESFCVESGRWNQRTGESDKKFDSSTKVLSSRKLKLSAKYSNDQSEVWADVKDQQIQLNYSMSSNYCMGFADVTANASGTSLQLALENKDLAKLKKEYEKELKELYQTENDIIGFAYAINGEIYGIDIYNNRELFVDLWEKLLESVIIEAITDKNSEKYESATINEVQDFMMAVDENSTFTNNQLNKETLFKIIEGADMSILFITIDCIKDQWIHKNYMKSTAEINQNKMRQSNDRLNNNNESQSE